MSDAYKIGVTVALSNLMGAELSKIIQQFFSADKAAASFASRLTLVAGATVAVGVALSGAVNEARKFQVEAAKFSLFGMDDGTNRQARAFAENMKIVGTSSTEAMRALTEAQGIFRESGKSGPEALKSAELFAPYMAKMDFVAKALHGDNAGKLHAENTSMLRFIDMMGANVGGDKAKEWVDFGIKLTGSTGGNVNWESLRQFRQFAKTAGSNLTPEAIAALEPMIQELKGAAGTGLSTAFNRINGLTKPPNQAVHEMMRSGIWDSSAVKLNRNGGIKSFVDGKNPLIDSELFSTNPEQWYEKHIVPLYQKWNLSTAQKQRENAIFFGAGTGGALFNNIDRQLSVIPGSVDSWRKAKNLDDSVEVARNTVDGKLVDLTAQWATLMKDMGQTLLPAVNNGLTVLNGTLKFIASIFEFMNKSHDAVKESGAGYSWIERATGVAMLSHFFGNNDNVPNMMPGGNQQPIILQTFLDGRVIAESTINHAGSMMSKNPSNGSSFDQRITPSYGLVY